MTRNHGKACFYSRACGLEGLFISDFGESFTYATYVANSRSPAAPHISRADLKLPLHLWTCPWASCRFSQGHTAACGARSFVPADRSSNQRRRLQARRQIWCSAANLRHAGARIEVRPRTTTTLMFSCCFRVLVTLCCMPSWIRQPTSNEPDALLSPVCAILGGFLAQEVIKFVSKVRRASSCFVSQCVSPFHLVSFFCPFPSDRVRSKENRCGMCSCSALSLVKARLFWRALTPRNIIRNQQIAFLSALAHF